MARLSIYVPDELKGRMDAVGDAVNWSEVARPAFVSAVANHEHRKGRSVSTAIERLRASKAQHLNFLEGGGKAAGRRWAENFATYAELKAVAGIGLENQDPDEAGALSVLVDVLDPQRESPDIFYETLGLEADRQLSGVSLNRYASAFVEGAQEFFEEVEDQL